MDFSPWFEKIYPSLSGYGLWLHGGEPNTFPASAFAESRFRLLIARLSTYRDTADSFTHKLLYQIAAGIPGTYPDMAFLPPPKDAEIFDRDGVPWLLGTTSKRSTREFNVIAISLSIVQELLNIAPMLRKSGIPLSKRERMADASCPLVILGGAGALHASFLFGADPCVDGIFVGEDAGTIRDLFARCRDGFAGNLDKRAILDSLRSIPGFFQPDQPAATSVFHANPLAAGQLLERGPILYDEGNIGAASLQISEGCAFACGFCAESFGRKPYREFDSALLRDAALRLKASMAVEKLELYSFNFSMHRSFRPLLAELASFFPVIGLKSQRLDSIAGDPDLLKFLHAVGKSSLTCGIEGISPRLRRYLHKSLTERELRQGLFALLTAPIRELKIFLIATGLEEQADYDAFRGLLALMREILQGSPRQPRIIFSMTILVRFPWTPLEFEDAPEADVCSAVLRTTERLVQAAGFEFRSSAKASEYWLSQLLVRIADPRIADAVRAACDAAGFVYYREIPSTLIDAIREELAKRGIAGDEPFKGHTPELRHVKPWSGIDTGVSEEFLTAQWWLAIQARDKGCCEDPVAGEASAGMVPCEAATLPLPARPEKAAISIGQFRLLLAAIRARETVINFRVRVGPALGAVPAAMRGTLLARALLAADPSLVPGYWGNRGSCVSGAIGWERVTGDDVLSLAWLRPADETVRQRMGDASFIRNVATHLGETMSLIGIAADFQTGIPVEIVFRSPYPFDPSDYCALKSLKYTLCKSGPALAEYRLSRESLKKKIWSRCTVEHQGDATDRVTIIPGPKFLPGEFARKAFRLPEKNDWVRIEIEGRLSK